MAAKPLPDQATLLKLLRYDPETGKLYWRERTPDLFSATRFDAQTMCENWNAANAGKPVYLRKNQKGISQIKIFKWRFSYDRVIESLAGRSA